MKWGGTLLAVAAAFVLRFEVLRDIPSLPMLFFLPAILTAAILFGRAYGLLAVALSAALADYFFLPPIYSFRITSSLSGLSLALFVAVALFVALMGSALRDAYRDADGLQRRTALLHREAEEARARAEAGERDRQLLLVEFGHRVKNDMQRITSSLQLRALHAGPEVATVLTEAANQVHVIAAMHDRLAHRDGEVMVEMDEFLADLVASLRGSMAAIRPIGLFVEAERHALPPDRAGAVGLIVNELVTNALKHAFPDDREGRVTVAFAAGGTDCRLTVADDGVGLPAPAAPSPRSSAAASRSRPTSRAASATS